MAIPVDRTRALRTNAELEAIVNAVHEAPPAEPETDCLEWKGAWDLSETDKAFHTARHLLGFANRTSQAAAGDFEGCAYLLAGVEPGSLVGVEPLDPAMIEDQLGRYIEAGRPRWTPSYVSLEGKHVLVVIVEAPRDGDPICTLQKTYDKAQKGRVFVRRHGKTEEADPAEMRALEERIRAQRPRVDLAVTRADRRVLHRLSMSAADKRGWLDAEAERLALPPEPSRKARGPFDFTPQIPQIATIEDARSRDDYRAEVTAYMNSAEARWLGHVIRRSIAGCLAEVRLQIENPTERNYEGVEVVVELTGEVHAFFDQDEVFERLGAPEPPKAWGKQKLYDINVPLVRHFESDTIERHDELTVIRFLPQHVRPKAKLALPAFHLVLIDPEQPLMINWRLTSTGVDGERRGQVSYEIASEPVAIAVAPA